MTTPGDDSYVITGKVCPPKLPMQNLASDGWNSITPSLLESLFTKTPAQGKHTSNLHSVCALSFQASVWLSTDGLQSSVVGLPYFFCSFCDYHSDSKNRLLQHMACKHVFKCKLCDFISFTRYKLIQHQLHQHLDAKEVQPVLGAQMVHLNLSLLYRCLQNLSQFESNSGTSTSPGNRPDETEPVNSSEINTSEEINDVPEEVICKVKYENSVSSTRTSTVIIPSVNGDSLSESDSHTLTGLNEPGGVFKRHSSYVEHSDSELSQKKFKTSDSKFDGEKALNQRPSSQMPHFLDESDSNVTSSCSPYKNTPTELFEHRKSEQNSLKKSQDKALSTNSSTRMLSFLMEPVGSSGSVDSVKSETNCNDNTITKFSTLQKILQWCNDQDDSNRCKQEDLGSSNVSDPMSDHSEGGTPTFLTASRDISLDERNQHQAFPKVTLEMPRQRSASDVSFCGLSAGLRDRQFRSRHSELQILPSQNVENFLAVPGIAQQKGKQINSNCNLSENDSVDDIKGCFDKTETRSGSDGGEKYDLLRRLLVGTSSVKGFTDTPAANTTLNAGKQSIASGSKDVSPFDCSKVSNERNDHRSHAKSVTRASDMTLKDLLTQGLNGLPSSLFCSFCNFRSPSQIKLQKHLEKCMCRGDLGKVETQNHSSGTSSWSRPSTDCSSGSMGQKMPPSASYSSFDCSYSSEKFRASEVLKGLSEHYSGRFGGGSSLQDKPQSSGDIAMSEESNLFMDLAFDKIGHTSDELNNDSGKHKRQKKKCESDSSYEPSNSSSSSNSDSDDKPSGVRKVVKKYKARKNSTKNVTANIITDSQSCALPPYLDQSLVLNKQHEIHQICLYCDFSTCSGINMRQHLNVSHPDCAPFSEALMQPKTKLYYCRGAQTGCTFVSCEPIEIFEHIKLCYSSYLDCFTYGDNETEVDYSQALVSLGIASRMIEQPDVMFYCLRCTYSKPDILQVADHVSEKHAKYVIGILSVNNIFEESKVAMVCLLCHAHVSVNLWASHPCRKRSEYEFSQEAVTDLRSKVSPNSKLETHLRQLSHQNCYQVKEITKGLLDSYAIGAEENDLGLEEDYKPEIEKLDISPLDSVLNQTRNGETCQQLARKPLDTSKSFEVVAIKQEILDTNSVKQEFDDGHEEFLDDVPVHFSTYGQNDTNQNSYQEQETGSNFNSSQTTTRRPSSGSSVLQSLLTGSQNARLTSKGYSLLHTLLKPIHTETEKGQSKPLPVLPAETSVPLNTNSQYPCILEMLSRQGCSTQETFFADNVSVSPRADRPLKEECVDYMTNSCKPLMANTFSSYSLTQQSQQATLTKCLPNLSTVVPSKTSSATVQEQLLSMIPQTPPFQLQHTQSPPLPLLETLSPPPYTALMTTDSQDLPGPFTNLLRLLSKSKVKPDSSQEPLL